MRSQELHPITDGTVYPPLPRQAKIQGTVKLSVAVKEGKATVRVISGHPLLAPASSSALEKWPFDGVTDGDYRVNYVYELTAPDYEVVYRKRGDAIDRFFLRLFHHSTTTENKVCVDSKVSASVKVELVDGYPGATATIHGQVCDVLNVNMYDIARQASRFNLALSSRMRCRGTAKCGLKYTIPNHSKNELAAMTLAVMNASRLGPIASARRNTPVR